LSETVNKQKCPCCQLPTISTLSELEICSVCEWNDDGQNDDNQDDVIGGPNGKYSLAASRKNFKSNKSMYRKGDSNFPSNPGYLRLQEELVDLYEEVSKGTNKVKLLKFIEDVERKRNITPKHKNRN
jgi:hypothetical protein